MGIAYCSLSSRDAFELVHLRTHFCSQRHPACREEDDSVPEALEREDDSASQVEWVAEFLWVDDVVHAVDAAGRPGDEDADGKDEGCAQVGQFHRVHVAELAAPSIEALSYASLETVLDLNLWLGSDACNRCRHRCGSRGACLPIGVGLVLGWVLKPIEGGCTRKGPRSLFTFRVDCRYLTNLAIGGAHNCGIREEILASVSGFADSQGKLCGASVG